MERIRWLSRALLMALAFAVALPAAPVLADNTADEAELRFRRGVEFYRQRRFEDALSEFFQSNRLVKNRNVLLNVARCYEQLGFFDEAYRYYNDVLVEEPEEADRQVLLDSLQRLAPRVALLAVETDPPGADVFVGRKDLGSRGFAPKVLALPPGKTRVMVSLPGHRDGEAPVVLERGKSVKVKVPLEFIWAEARLEGGPEGAEVRIDRADGEPDGRLPATLKLKPGRHTLHVAAEGFSATQLPVDARAGERSQHRVELLPLPPPTGSLMATANHKGALVEVNGRESGFTPTVVPLPEGRYRVRVSLEELAIHEEEVLIRAGEMTRVDAELRYGAAKTTAASKVESSIEDAPASITVISRDEILAFGYTTLPDALRAVRGMFLSNDRTYEFLGVRGFSPPGDLNNRILILYDGHAMNDIYAGQAYLGRENNIDLAEVERIEVVRGPVSSLFGSAAFFGVINIVPRQSLGAQRAEVSGAAGSMGLGRARGTVGYRGEKGGDGPELLGTFGGLTSAGEETLFMPEGVVRNRDGERALNASARAAWKGLSLLGSINNRTKHIPTGAYGTLLGASDTQVNDRRGFVEGRYERAFSGGASLSARAYYDGTRFQGNYRQPDPVGMEVDTGGADWGGVELRYRSPEVLRQRLTVGGEVQRQFRIFQSVTTDEGAGLDDRRAFNVASAYAVDEIRLGKLLLINGSVRADYYFDGPEGTPSFGLTLNPRLAFISRLYQGGLTKLMGGRSFRAPTAYERFYHDGVEQPDGRLSFLTSRPNPGLGPETILTAELEHSHQVGSDLRLTGALFVNQISQLIGTSVDADGLAFSDNTPGQVRTQGAEVELRWQPRRLTMVTASYWFQQMRTFAQAESEREALLRANAPAHAFSLRAMHPLLAPSVLAAVELVYNSRRLTRDGGKSVGEVLFLNAGLSGTVGSAGFRYYAGVQNLLDERPELPASAEITPLTLPSYGRTFLLQLAASY